jgi:hypothetical protein
MQIEHVTMWLVQQSIQHILELIVFALGSTCLWQLGLLAF